MLRGEEREEEEEVAAGAGEMGSRRDRGRARRLDTVKSQNITVTQILFSGMIKAAQCLRAATLPHATAPVTCFTAAPSSEGCTPG